MNIVSEHIFQLLFWFLIGILLVIRGASALRLRQAGEQLTPDKEAIQREGVAAFGIRLVAFLVLVGIMVAYAFYPPWMAELSIHLSAWLRLLALFGGLAGMSLLTQSQAELGRQWSTNLQLRQDHQLVTSGPYARIRHPLYTSMFAFGTAFGLLTANWIFLCFAIVMIAGLYLRVPKEEQMMLEQFGEQYNAYMKQTSRFFPQL